MLHSRDVVMNGIGRYNKLMRVLIGFMTRTSGDWVGRRGGGEGRRISTERSNSDDVSMPVWPGSKALGW